MQATYYIVANSSKFFFPLRGYRSTVEPAGMNIIGIELCQSKMREQCRTSSSCSTVL